MSKLGVLENLRSSIFWFDSLSSFCTPHFRTLEFYQGSNCINLLVELLNFVQQFGGPKLRFAPLPTINLVNPLALKSLTRLLCVPLRVQKQPSWSWTAMLDPSPEVGVASCPIRLKHQPTCCTYSQGRLWFVLIPARADKHILRLQTDFKPVLYQYLSWHMVLGFVSSQSVMIMMPGGIKMPFVNNQNATCTPLISPLEITLSN